jgi:hypothetical protein
MAKRSIITDIRPDTYWELKNNGQLLVTKYLRLEAYPRNKGVYGFSGWDMNETRKGFRVYDADDKFLSTWYAVFLGEVFFRFPTVISSWKKMPTGSQYRNYIVEVVIDNESHLLYAQPGGKLSVLFENNIRRMTDKNCHEHVWRAWRSNFNKAEHQMDCFYHDIDLEPIDMSRISENHCHIIDETPYKDIDWFRPPIPTELDKDSKKLLKDDRVSTVAQYLKEKVIPLEIHPPEESDYISWFTKLAGLNPIQARKVYEHRDYYGMI